MEEEKEVWRDNFSILNNKNIVFPMTFGRECIDKYWIKYGDGSMSPWPTDEDRARWKEQVELFDKYGELPINPNQQV